MSPAVYVLVLCTALTVLQVHSSHKPSILQYPPPPPDPRNIIFPYNPCPFVFDYRYNQSLGWFHGHLKVPVYAPVSIYLLEVNMSVNSEVQQNDGLRIAVLSTQNQILNGPEIEYAIYFPHVRPLPSMTQVKFNENILCRGDPPPLISGVVQSAMWTRSTIRATTNGGGDYGNSQYRPQNNVIWSQQNYPPPTNYPPPQGYLVPEGYPPPQGYLVPEGYPPAQGYPSSQYGYATLLQRHPAPKLPAYHQPTERYCPSPQDLLIPQYGCPPLVLGYFPPTPRHYPPPTQRHPPLPQDFLP